MCNLLNVLIFSYPAWDIAAADTWPVEAGSPDIVEDNPAAAADTRKADHTASADILEEGNRKAARMASAAGHTPGSRWPGAKTLVLAPADAFVVEPAAAVALPAAAV